MTSTLSALLILFFSVTCAAELPALSSKHLRTLSDHRGISEFAKGTLPLNERFCIEDTARALVAVLKIHELQPSEETIDLAKLYLKVISELQDADGRFRFGYQSTSGRMDRIANGDNFTRVLWGLGLAAHHGVDDAMRASAATMFEKALPHLDRSSEHLMAKAYAIQGLTEYLRAKPHDAAADQALKLYNAGHSLYCRASQELESEVIPKVLEEVGVGINTSNSDRFRRGEIETFFSRKGHLTDFHVDFQESIYHRDETR
jgi:hypothetical protein